MKKSIIAVLAAIIGVAFGVGVDRRVTSQKIKKQSELAKKHFDLYLLMNEWVRVKQENRSVAEYLEKKGYKEIAIYGMHYVGETLLKEISGTGIKVKYGIDRNADNIFTDVDVVSPERQLDKVDAVIITAIAYYDEIEQQLSEKLDCPVISIEDILYEI